MKKSYTEEFKNYLQKRGMKFTPERKIILDEVFSLRTHFDVERLYKKLHRYAKGISWATIYRTLPLLIESGLVREALRYKEKVSYEHTFGQQHHDHMVCIGCGKIIEFRDERIERLQDKICKKYKFTPVEHRLGIKGYCDKCKSR